MILDCVCVDIRISRSPLPRMLAMVLLCGYSGHGDTETLAPAPVQCTLWTPLLSSLVSPPARPGQGRGRCSVHKYSFQPALGWCIALRRVAPQTGLYLPGFTQTEVVGIQYIKWHFQSISGLMRSGRGWVNSWERGTVQSSVRLICLGQLCLLTRHQATASGQWSRQQHDLGWKHLLILWSQTRRYLALCSP